MTSARVKFSPEAGLAAHRCAQWVGRDLDGMAWHDVRDAATQVVSDLRALFDELEAQAAKALTAEEGR